MPDALRLALVIAAKDIRAELRSRTALLSAVVLLPTFTHRGNSLVPLGVVGLALLLYVYFHPGVRSARWEAAGADLPESASVVELDRRRAERRRAER